MSEDKKKVEKILVFRPISIFYFIFLLFLTILLLPFIIVMGKFLGYVLEVPSYLVLIVFLVSLFGSYVNIPVTKVKSSQPTINYREVNFLGIRWYIPEIGFGRRETIIAINLGGAIVPVLFSIYLLLFSIPTLENNLVVAYGKNLVAFIIVTLVVHATAKPIRGLGIATPSFIPPITAALTATTLFPIYLNTNPFIIAYVAGTLGTLVGADLLNLNKISKLGSPMVSIGGAGIFDGVYMTGIMATLLLWLIL